MLAGYLIATVLQVPSLLFEARGEPRNLLMRVTPDQDLSDLPRQDLQFAIARDPVQRRRGDPRPALARRDAAAAPRDRARRRGPGGVALVVVGRRQRPRRARARARTGPTCSSSSRSPPCRSGSSPGCCAAASRRPARCHRWWPGWAATRGRTRCAPRWRRRSATRRCALAYWLPDGERFVDADGRPVARRTWARGREVELQRQPDRRDRARPRARRRAASSCARPAARRRSRSRTSGWRRRCARGSRSCARRGRGSSRPATPSAGGSSATCTTARSRGSSRWRSSSGSRSAARRSTPSSPPLLEEAGDELQASLDEVRELARGIHPAVLTDRGLDAALRSLAVRAPVPVDVAGGVPDDLPGPVATARLLRRRRGADERGEVRVGVGRDRRRRALGGRRASSRSPTTAIGGADVAARLRAARARRPRRARWTAGSRSTARPEAARASGWTSRCRHGPLLAPPEPDRDRSLTAASREVSGRSPKARSMVAMIEVVSYGVRSTRSACAGPARARAPGCGCSGPIVVRAPRAALAGRRTWSHCAAELVVGHDDQRVLRRSGCPRPRAAGRRGGRSPCRLAGVAGVLVLRPDGLDEADRLEPAVPPRRPAASRNSCSSRRWRARAGRPRARTRRSS